MIALIPILIVFDNLCARQIDSPNRESNPYIAIAHHNAFQAPPSWRGSLLGSFPAPIPFRSLLRLFSVLCSVLCSALCSDLRSNLCSDLYSDLYYHPHSYQYSNPYSYQCFNPYSYQYSYPYSCPISVPLSVPLPTQIPLQFLLSLLPLPASRATGRFTLPEPGNRGLLNDRVDFALRPHG